MKPTECRKVTLVLTVETDFRLGILAKLKRVDRSAIAEKLLADGLAHVEVTVRGEAFGEPARPEEAAA